MQEIYEGNTHIKKQLQENATSHFETLSAQLNI